MGAPVLVSGGASAKEVGREGGRLAHKVAAENDTLVSSTKRATTVFVEARGSASEWQFDAGRDMYQRERRLSLERAQGRLALVGAPLAS